MNQSLEREINDTKQELLKIKGWIDNNKMDSKVSYLNAYSVIKASGTIEQVLKNILFDKLSDNISEEAKHYLSKHILESSYNPSTGQIQKLLQDINSSWWSSLDKMIAKKNHKNNLNSLVQLRNAFSHGNSINESIDVIILYYESGIEIIKYLNEIINK